MLLLLENNIPESAFLGNQQKHMKSGNFPDLIYLFIQERLGDGTDSLNDFKRGWGMVLTL